MKECVKKRGLSPVIASVLMILLVIVLAAIIFLWARGFIGEQVQKFGEPIERSWDDVSFDVWRGGINDATLEVRNTGNVDIRYLAIKTIKGGNSEMKRFNFEIRVGGDPVSDDVTFAIEDPDEIIAYPVLVADSRGSRGNAIFTCLDAGVVI